MYFCKVRNKFIFNLKEKDDFCRRLLFFSEKYKHFCLLDSNSSENSVPDRYFEYDFICAFDAIETLSSCDNSILKVKNLHSKFNDWMFGYLSYDLKDEFYNLPSKGVDHLNSDHVSFFIPKYVMLVKDNQLEVLTHMNKESINSLLNQIFNYNCNEQKINNITFKARESKKSYLQKINEIKYHIKRGDIYEINYCQEFFNDNILISPHNIFYYLNKSTKSPFASFLKNDNINLMGFSPERYLCKNNSKVISQPIKGTSKRSNDSDEDNYLFNNLIKSKKDISENIMIVDLVRNDLSITAKSGSVNVDKLCGVYSFSNVHQMISTISSELENGTHFTDVIKSSFPMGSMTGAPKKMALTLIDKFEENKRSLYSGSVGYITPAGDFDFNVVIRSLIYNYKRKYLSLSVGGAITSKSIPLKEYEECIIKAQPIFNAFNHVLDEI